ERRAELRTDNSACPNLRSAHRLAIELLGWLNWAHPVESSEGRGREESGQRSRSSPDDSPVATASKPIRPADARPSSRTASASTSTRPEGVLCTSPEQQSVLPTHARNRPSFRSRHELAESHGVPGDPEGTQARTTSRGPDVGGRRPRLSGECASRAYADSS